MRFPSQSPAAKRSACFTVCGGKRSQARANWKPASGPIDWVGCSREGGSNQTKWSLLRLYLQVNSAHWRWLGVDAYVDFARGPGTAIPADLSSDIRPDRIRQTNAWDAPASDTAACPRSRGVAQRGADCL